MAVRYVIGPSIGLARLGNSPTDFYLEPETIGGLPIQCNDHGDVPPGPNPPLVSAFKDGSGRVKRQAARFRVYRIDDEGSETEITAATPGVLAMTWSVHLANKKAAWYSFSELEGNLLYGQANSYANTHVPLRNATVTDATERQKLIIDPGPRRLTGPRQSSPLTAAAAPSGYRFVSFPGPVTQGQQVRTLGEIRTDSAGRLIILGGYGVSGGDEPISSFGGADTWHDDIADGPVSCVLELASGDIMTLQAWCIVGSPKFAPEIVNVSTLDDTMYDVAVRHLGAAPTVFADGAFNRSYVANFDRDIRPVLDRPGAYRWVANVPSMNSLSPPAFDPRDATSATAALRQVYVSLFRRPGPEHRIDPTHQQLFADIGFPLMPLNSGSNSVSDTTIDKFVTLTETQYFFLEQWAAGRFTTAPPAPEPVHIRLSRASTGNCVGNPFCPGIEVTWSTRNQNIYDGPWSIMPRPGLDYFADGLSSSRDETADHTGCEPGDLTKRMAIPWQADFFQCSIQYINFTDPNRNKSASGIPVPPTYYAYWWPPQSPWQIMTGDLTTEGQIEAGTPAGQQVLYTRGINTFEQMINCWHYMGFIVNQTQGAYRGFFPYFTEQERAHDKFTAAAVAVGEASNVVTGADTNFANTWFVTPTKPATPPAHGPMVTFSTSRRRGRIPSNS